MTLHALLEAMEADGLRELTAVLAEHEREAQALVASAREQAHDDHRRRLAQAEVDARARARRILGEAGAASRATLRAALEAQLQQVHSSAITQLGELVGSTAGVQATLRLLDEALAQLPSATTCQVDPAHVESVRAHHPALDVQATGEHAGAGIGVGIGVVVLDDAGRAVDNTATARLEAAWPRLRPVLAAALEPEREAPLHAELGAVLDADDSEGGTS